MAFPEFGTELEAYPADALMRKTTLCVSALFRERFGDHCS